MIRRSIVPFFVIARERSGRGNLLITTWHQTLFNSKNPKFIKAKFNMLTQIYIKHFAIIEELNCDFEHGFTVMTGETGAGKSIICDALAIALGDRADSQMIYPGAEQFTITASFALAKLQEARDLLEAQGFSETENCTITRIMNANGRSKNLLNGRPVSLQELKTLGEFLVQIHSQHQHIALLKPENQREILDQFAKNKDLLAEIKSIYAKYQSCLEALQQLENQEINAHARLSFLQFQLNEIEQLKPLANEYDELIVTHKQLANYDNLIEACQVSLNLIYENEHSVSDQLSHIQQKLSSISQNQAPISEINALISNAAIQIDEAYHSLKQFTQQLNNDPKELARLEQRLSDYHQLARKYKTQPQLLYEWQAQLKTEIAAYENKDEKISAHKIELEKIQQDYLAIAKTLSKNRLAAAKQLNSALTETIKTLGIPHGELQFHLQKTETETPKLFGQEQVELLFCAHPSAPLDKLSRVASGGELSRISLAVEANLISSEDYKTLIFDEVDVGISGATAEIVGKLLRNLSAQHQILCITHLPQVAALGHQHFKITKSSDQKAVKTRLETLDEKTRTEEIARLLGGIKITEKTREHARELLNLAV